MKLMKLFPINGIVNVYTMKSLEIGVSSYTLRSLNHMYTYLNNFPNCIMYIYSSIVY